MKKKLASILVVKFAGLLLFVGNAVAEIGTYSRAAYCIEVNTHSTNNTPNYVKTGWEV